MTDSVCALVSSARTEERVGSIGPSAQSELTTTTLKVDVPDYTETGHQVPDLSRARCSVDFDWVTRDVRDLVLNENLQNEQSHFVLKSIAQSFNRSEER